MAEEILPIRPPIRMVLLDPAIRRRIKRRVLRRVPVYRRRSLHFLVIRKRIPSPENIPVAFCRINLSAFRPSTSFIPLASPEPTMITL